MPNEKLLGTGSGQTTLRVAAAVLLVAVALLLVLRLPAGAQANDGDVSGVTLTSPNPGELVITWDAPGNAPDDYRVTWKKSTAKWPSHRSENTIDGGNAFPTGTSHTVTGLEEGTAYKARVRARYHNSGGKVEKSGPWSVVQEVTVSATPAPTAQPPANEGRSTNPPAKPASLLTAANHDSVLLSWTDPGDDSVTGYQVLRGPDADNLTTLADDTGSATSSYTDSNVAAQTTYAYAIRARNARGLGPQSDPVTATTSTAPEEDEPPTSARAIADAEFTLDGQDLDTSDSNCLEDNIGDITADCTINIDTTTVIFAVVGTLDSNDRLNVKIGRDKAAVDAASESADESDLRGTDQTVTLTFPVGISLMRVWGDENTSPGGSEEHFYRVNVGRTATIEAVKSSIVEGEEEVRFRIILSSQAPAGGVNVRVELSLLAPADPGPIAAADLRVHTVNIPQGQTQAILEVQSSRNEILSRLAQVNAAIQTGTGYIVGSDSEASVEVKDPDRVNIAFAAGCGQTISVGEGDGEVSFDIVLDNPVSYDFGLVLIVVGGTASAGNDYVNPHNLLDFPGHQTRATASVKIIDDTQVEGAEEFEIRASRNGLDDDILTPTCGKTYPQITIEITDNDTANIVLDAPEEVTEGDPIKIGLGPRPNANCPVPFQFTTTVTVTADRANLEDTPRRSETLEQNVCQDPDRIKIQNDDGTTSEPVWQTIDRTGQQGGRRVTFTIGTLRSSDSRVSQLSLERRSATVIIKDKPNNKATGNRIIAGDPMVGQTLTLDISAISEPDGLTNARFTYRWYKTYREDTEELSTADSYTVPEEDKGDRIRLTVSFTDDEGFQEEVTGAPTAAVVPYLEHYLLITEKSMIEAQTGTREVSTWVYLNDWPRVRSADGSRIHNWGANPIVAFTVPYTVDYADGAAASWVEVADVTFTATRQSPRVIGFQGRSEMIVTIKQISKNVPYGEDLGKVIITLDDGINLPNGPKLNAREGRNVLTITILSNGK